VVGHVEWVRFARVPHVPHAGEIVHARDPFEEPAGGGAVAAVQLARLAGSSTLLTALGDDDPELVRRMTARLRELGVQTHLAPRAAPTRTAVTLLDDAHQRTITTFGPRLQPSGADTALPWDELADMDAVYFTAGDLAALRAARTARVLVASPRALDALGHNVPLDALVLSSDDPTEHHEAARTQDDAELLVCTAGARGGVYRRRGSGGGDDDVGGDGGGGSRRSGGGSSSGEGSWAAAPPPGPVVDSYGCGDSFAAGLTYGLGAGMPAQDAIDLAARCGAACLTGHGPYEHYRRGS